MGKAVDVATGIKFVALFVVSVFFCGCSGVGSSSYKTEIKLPQNAKIALVMRDETMQQQQAVAEGIRRGALNLGVKDIALFETDKDIPENIEYIVLLRDVWTKCTSKSSNIVGGVIAGVTAAFSPITIMGSGGGGTRVDVLTYDRKQQRIGRGYFSRQGGGVLVDCEKQLTAVGEHWAKKQFALSTPTPVKTPTDINSEKARQVRLSNQNNNNEDQTEDYEKYSEAELAQMRKREKIEEEKRREAELIEKRKRREAELVEEHKRIEIEYEERQRKHAERQQKLSRGCKEVDRYIMCFDDNKKLKKHDKVALARLLSQKTLTIFGYNSCQSENVTWFLEKVYDKAITISLLCDETLMADINIENIARAGGKYYTIKNIKNYKINN